MLNNDDDDDTVTICYEQFYWEWLFW